MNKTIISIVLSALLFSCSKKDDYIDAQTLKNTVWVDSKAGIDTLRLTDSLLFRGSAKDFGIYSYHIKNDVLYLYWKGPEKILIIEPFTYKIEASDNVLIINNFDNCYYPPQKYQTDTFKKVGTFNLESINNWRIH